MTAGPDYTPKTIFSLEERGRETPPFGLIAPARYVQGPGLLDELGHFLALVPSRRPAVLISAGGLRRHREQLLAGLGAMDSEPVFEIFEGQCCLSEIERAAASLRAREASFDSLIAVGGGKCLDAGKSVAARLEVPAVICPTIASTDAPCSALSVLYSDEGIVQGGEFFPDSPALVLVDSQLIAAAPVRYLVAGMGDALATRYEARTCTRNPAGRSVLGGRPTVAAQAIAEQCAQTIFDDGIAAAEAAFGGEVNAALERVIEANTLLSGIGFESGGVTGAHAVAGGFTHLPHVRARYLHGEMVAMGLLAQLALEQSEEECAQVARFNSQIGLPTHLAQLSLELDRDGAALKEAMAAIAVSPLMDHEPLEVTPENTWAALLRADEIGRAATAAAGDSAYRRLHA
ncbi:MAG: glycerol dehydrogenase [Caldilineaceae bacterium]|nr:glycerol dehydrogenase [Caldilineaceae bacterium]